MKTHSLKYIMNLKTMKNRHTKKINHAHAEKETHKKD